MEFFLVFSFPSSLFIQRDVDARKGVMEIYFPLCSLVRSRSNKYSSKYTFNRNCRKSWSPFFFRTPALSVFFTESAIAFRTESGEKNKYSFAGVIAARLGSFYFLPLCEKRRRGKTPRKVRAQYLRRHSGARSREFRMHAHPS